jgi:hypothetical protein
MASQPSPDIISTREDVGRLVDSPRIPITAPKITVAAELAGKRMYIIIASDLPK